MKAKKRREKIVELASQGEIGVKDLEKQFSVTASTIRRDLASLASEGKILRTLSGAAPVSGSLEGEFSEREKQFVFEKSLIAMRAEQFVAPNSTIYIDAGTTCSALAKKLDPSKPVRIVTPNLSVLRSLSLGPDSQVEVLGGRYRAISDASYGQAGIKQLEQYFFDAVFLSADQISIDLGLKEESSIQIELKRAAINATKNTIILADASKIETEPRSGMWLPIPENGVIVSNSRPPHQLTSRPDISWISVD